VAQRRREIGILRALGTTRSQVMVLFIGEGLFLGALGAVLGIGFGMLLARWVLKVVAGTLSSLYTAVDSDVLIIGPSDVITAAALGVAVSMIAAFAPARRAAFVDPASIMRKTSDTAGGSQAALVRSLKIGGVLLVLAVIVAVTAHIQGSVKLGYAVSAFGAFAAAFFSPALARLIGTIARRTLGRRDPALLLGSVGFVRNAGRNAIAIAALGMSLGNAVNADALMGSMKHNTQRWLDRSAHADLFVFAGQGVKATVEHPLPESIGEELSKLPGVEYVDPGRRIRERFRGQQLYVGAVELRQYLRYNDIPVAAGNLDRALTMIEAGTGVSASQNFINSFHMKLGDKITLNTPAGPHTFEIALVHVDYGSEIGVLTTTRSVYKRLWSDPLVDSFGVYLRPGTDVDKTRTLIADDLGKRFRLLALSNGQYKGELVKVLEGSFTLARATEFVAIIVAILGIINTLLVTVMDRRTEIAVLKVIGAVSGQVQRMLMIEGSLIGLAATVLGVGFGSLFSIYVVKELLRLQVGWQMSWQVSWWALLETFVVAQVVSVIAVWLPMRAANRIDSVTALQNE
jgi:putative ABC transport system permease protein